MMRAANVFFDTEFGGFLPHQVRLISIGFVSEHNRSLYLELEGVTPEMCSPFVLDSVLPLLNGGPKTSRDDAAVRVRDYLVSFGCAVTLWTDSPGYDAFLLSELVAGVRKELPEIRICTPEFDGLSARMHYVNHSEVLFETRQLRRHHALDDAKAMRNGWLAVQRCKPSKIEDAARDPGTLDHFTAAPSAPESETGFRLSE